MDEFTYKTSLTDDAWVPSSCALCYGSCSILAHRVGGVVVKIEGNPKSAVGRGHLCGKGISGLMTQYDPNRITRPLRRTNPKKGLGVDPGFEEISWDEALDEIADHLRRIRADDPRKLTIQRTTTVTAHSVPFRAFTGAFGTPNISEAGGGLHCGNGAHIVSGMMHSSWGIVPDFQHCNYAIYFGASKGHSAGHVSCTNMNQAADARARGMKMVVVDPMCNFAAAKATEWVPLRVGTDAALALAICNVLVNELGTIDEAYLRAKTNGAYLIGADGRYARDGETDKPQVWDEAAGEAVPFDGTNADAMALEGEFPANGGTCRPAFALLKEHLKKFTPEMAADITTVPAETIRRLAADFAREARIGANVVIDGVTVPHRPAAAIAFRGNQGHRNSIYNFLSVDLMNHLVGAADVVGGCLGFNPAHHGHPDTGRLRYIPNPAPDGIMKVGMWMGFEHPYPIREPRHPEQLGLQDMFPMSMTPPFLHSSDREEMWSRFDLPYRPEMLLNFGANLVMSVANKETVAESLCEYDFMISFDLFVTETSAFCDIVLPDCGYLQSYNSRPNFPFIFNQPAGLGEWCWPVQQPVVEPAGEQRRFSEILIELAHRAGFGPDLNAVFNAALNLEPEHRLDIQRKYTYVEVCDADLKSNFGNHKGLAWFKENGVLKWPKKPEEVYWRAFTDVRVPIYWEWMEDMGEKIAAIAEPRGLEIPREFYKPLPDFLPCVSHECAKPEFDCYSFYYRDTLHTNSYTMENAWLDEAARLDPFSYNIALNAETGRKKGLETGDRVRVETETGRHVEGRLRLTEAIHPEGVGIAALAGHWATTLPTAKGKGVFYNDLLEIDWAHCSPVNLNLDLCAKVKVTKVE